MSDKHVFVRNHMEPPRCRRCQGQPDDPIHQMGDIQRAAARPKVSEDDEKAAEGIIEDWIEANQTLVGELEIQIVRDLHQRIAADRAAVRLAERRRIREAVEKLHTFKSGGTPGVYIIRTEAVAAIDGQPIRRTLSDK